MSLGACCLTDCVAEVSALCVGYQPYAHLPRDRTKLSITGKIQGLSKSCNNEQNYKEKKTCLLR